MLKRPLLLQGRLITLTAWRLLALLNSGISYLLEHSTLMGSRSLHLGHLRLRTTLAISPFPLVGWLTYGVVVLTPQLPLAMKHILALDLSHRQCLLYRLGTMPMRRIELPMVELVLWVSPPSMQMMSSASLARMRMDRRLATTRVYLTTLRSTYRMTQVPMQS